TKVDTKKDVKKDVSPLRYIVLPNWVHEEHLESSPSQHQEAGNTDVSESSGNLNPTATSTNPPADPLDTLTVETPIPTASSPVPTEEILQFKIQKVWSLVDCPQGVRPIGTKWVLKNKKDERGIVVRNKARLVDENVADLLTKPFDDGRF
nr:ribonuclease H-like domain-containing protein [Tanacetum cinerariifolium]